MKVIVKDFPIEDVTKEAEKRIAEVGGYIHQKWTCKHCGSRQTMGEKNTFFSSGKCEECGKLSPITHCNYLFVIKRPVLGDNINENKPNKE